MSEEIKYTHRTRDGRKARIICTNRVSVGVYPIVALVCCGIAGEEVSATYTAELRYSGKPGATSMLDLFEYNPWRDVPIDTPIWVSSGNVPSYNWIPGHFAGLNARGDYYYIWSHQGTSHTKTTTEPYLYATLENPNTPTKD